MAKNNDKKFLPILELLHKFDEKIVALNKKMNHKWDALFSSRTFFMVVSIAMSIIIWLFVAFSGDTETVRTINTDIKYINVPGRLSLYAPVTEVELKIAGRANLVTGLDDDEIVAVVDLANISAGKYNMPIRFNLPPFARVVKSTPAAAHVELFRNVERTFDIKPIIQGELPQGKIVASVAFAPEKCTISGPESEILSIEGVEAEVPLDKLNDNKIKTEIKINMPQGNSDTKKERLVLSPSETIATVTFEDETIGDRIPIKVPIVGEPADGLQIESIKITPESVAVKGRSDAVKEMQSLVLPPVDITGLEDDIQIMLPLKPDNMSDEIEISGPDKARVEIHLSKKLAVKTISSLPVAVEGSEHGKEWHITPRTVSVTIEGPQKVLEAFTHSAPPCELYVDVSNIVSKQVEVPVLVRNVKKDIQIVRTEPEQVIVSTSE